MSEELRAAMTLPWQTLELPVRMANAIRFDGTIHTIGDITQRSATYFMRMPGIGRVSVNHLRDALAEHGLHFDMIVCPLCGEIIWLQQ